MEQNFIGEINMPRYIDIEPYDSCLIVANSEDSGIKCKDIQTAYVLEVKHGKWINERGTCFNTYRECNLCHHVTDDYVINEDRRCFDAPFYCPNCGARMDGDAE